MQQDVTSATPADCGHHVGLTSEEPDGRLVRELVPARCLDDGLIEITGSPALVMGCAAGDVLRVEESGRFEVLRRGPNVSAAIAGQEAGMAPILFTQPWRSKARYSPPAAL